MNRFLAVRAYLKNQKKTVDGLAPIYLHQGYRRYEDECDSLIMAEE